MQFPGNKTHQKVLQILLKLFQNYADIDAFLVFGSLGRGNWDDYSDLDLDVVVKDDSREIIQQKINEMTQILTMSGFEILASFEEFPNEQVFILNTLDRIGIRFHVLMDTNWTILNSMRILYGKLSKEDIVKASVKKERIVDIELLNNKFLELSIYVPLSLKRNKLINALFFLNKMRRILIQIYMHSHGLERELDFESSASASIANHLYETYGACNSGSIHAAFDKLLKFYQMNIAQISGGKIHLSDNQFNILNRIRDY